nr:hypothetical protein [Clostridia bacterium]
MKKHITSLILAALMLSSALLTACSGEGGSDNETNSGDTTAAETTAAETTTGRESLNDNVPELDFEGKTLTVLSRSENPYIGEIYAEDLNGEVVNDAVWTRNDTVEQRLNIEINVTEREGTFGKHNEFMAMVSTNILAESVSPYDVISYYAYCNSNFSSQGLLYNMLDVPHLDLDAPWWHSRFIENAEVYGKLYMLAGDINLTATSMRYAMFFNKQLVENYLDTDVYTDVIEGAWTREYFHNLVKDVYVDINGDSEAGVEDLYGWDANLCYDAYSTGCGLTFTQKTSDGGFEYNLYSPKNEDIIETFYEMLSEKGVYYVDKADATRFPNSLSMFYAEKLNYTDKLREMKDDYGIVPMPKYDEAQDAYYTIADDNYSQVMIPVNAGDLELCGAFLEIMSAESYKFITPAYFETTMKDKYLRDENSIKMLDLIVEGAYYDFAAINTFTLGYPVFTVRSAMQHHENKNFATHWAEDESMLTKNLENLLEKYSENAAE